MARRRRAVRRAAATCRPRLERRERRNATPASARGSLRLRSTRERRRPHGPHRAASYPRPRRARHLDHGARRLMAQAVASTREETRGALDAEQNPLTAGLERLPVPPTSLVIFGATGDLARRKILPALYNLAHEGALPERFHMVGAARRETSDAEYRGECSEAIRTFSRRTPDEDVLTGLLENVLYVAGGF